MAGGLTNRFLGVLAGGALFVVSLLPVRVASIIGGWLGKTVGPYLRPANTARRNLKSAFPDWSDDQIERTMRDVWENFGCTAFEFPHLDKLTYGGPNPDVEVEGVPILDRVRAGGQPAIFVSGHLANWEVLALTAFRHGIDLDLVYRAPNNPAVDALMRRRHIGEGELIPKGSQGARRVMKRLATGHHLGALIDQKMNDGIAVPFFGRPAMTAPAVAQLALRFKCPIVPARIERLGPARFRVVVDEPFMVEEKGTRAETILAVMTDLNERLESWIRNRPGEWFWVHKRWPD